MSNDFTLKNAKLFRDYKITGCNLSRELMLRFYELGMTVGTTVKVVKTAPLGDPLEITVRGYTLCIRKSVAEHFIVEEVRYED